MNHNHKTGGMPGKHGQRVVSQPFLHLGWRATAPGGTDPGHLRRVAAGLALPAADASRSKAPAVQTDDGCEPLHLDPDHAFCPGAGIELYGLWAMLTGHLTSGD